MSAARSLAAAMARLEEIRERQRAILAAEKLERILRVYWGACTCEPDEHCVECDPV